MNTQIIIRVENELKEKFSAISRLEGKTTSQALRSMMEDYVRDRDFSTYVEDAWEIIGKDFKSKGITESRIEKTIAAVRKNNKSKHDAGSY